MIIVSYLGLMPDLFQFAKEKAPRSPERKPLLPAWFYQGLTLISASAVLTVALKPVLKTDLSELAFKNKKPAAEKDVALKPSEEDFTLPPLLVSLKSENGMRLARVRLSLKVSRSAVKQEILSNKKATRKRLLVLLSGRESRDLQSEKTQFENRLVSWMNAFLSQGSVNKVTIHTTFLN